MQSQESFRAAYERLNDAQRLAVDTIDGPVLVVAGPGTGKTQLLTTRIAAILQRTDALPENILCLTFTDSAAHTMRERLTGIVGQAAYNITITTYHAFGSELIRRYPEYFASTADLQPVDDLTIDSIFRDIQAHLPYSNPLKYETFLRDVKTLVSDSKRALLGPQDLDDIASANEAFIMAASALAEEQLEGLKRIDKSAVSRFQAILERSDNLPAKQIKNVVPLAVQWQQQLSDALASFNQTNKTNELTKWKKTWLAKDENNHWVAAGADQARKIRAASAIYSRYLERLAELGLYDFDDMILHAIQGLEANADLRYTLQERYQYLLLDEYQDTNEAQSRLVELLTDNPVNEGRPNVLAVGDDDQAIYAFQGANYSHMLNFYEHYRDVLVVPLTQNYRSHADILHTSKGIAEQIEHRLHHHFPAIDKTITAANSNLPTKAVVERHEFKSDLSQDAWVAKQIKSLKEQGIPANQIAVLAPKHQYLEALVPFLHHQGLAVHYDKRENVLEDECVSQLIVMSRLVLALAAGDHNRANPAWSQVISLPLWDLPTSLVWSLSWEAADEQKPWTDVLCGHDETKAIALFFIRLSQLAATEPLEVMLDYLIGVDCLDLKEPDIESFTSPFYSHYFEPTIQEQVDTLPFWNLLSNLTVIRQRLREYRTHEDASLRLQDFITFVEANEAADIKILNTNPYQESSEAVELLTAYKAKGQEFAAVFIIAAVDEVWGTKARALGSRLSLPENLRFIRYAGATEDERLRLLYVAMTRAETQLYITSYISNYAGRLMTRLKYLDERTEADGTIISPLLPEGEQTVIQQDVIPPDLQELTVYWQHRHYHAIKQAELKDLLGPRLEHYQLSPTQFNRFLDITCDGPSKFFIETLLRFPGAPTVSGEFGNAMHETLEWIHVYNKRQGSLPTQAQIFQTFDNRLRAKRLGEPHTSLLTLRGHEALAAYIAQRLDTVSANNLCEYNFRNEGVFVGTAHLSGKIDKLIIDKQSKTITIVDYKTGTSHSRWYRDSRLHFYRYQLYLYKILVEHSRSFAGYTVTDAYLEFVEPDEGGKIVELHTDFDPELQTRLEQLLQIVWQHVQNLSFPDVSSYDNDMKGIEQFEQDLLDGTV